MAWPDDLITLPDWLAGFVSKTVIEDKTTDRFNLLVPRIADTGWQTITPGGAYTGVSWAVRKVGSEVKIRGHVNKNSGNFSTTSTAVGDLPDTSYAPTVSTRIAVCGAGGADGDTGGGIMRLAAGSTSIELTAPTGASWTAVYTTATWMVD